MNRKQLDQIPHFRELLEETDKLARKMTVYPFGAKSKAAKEVREVISAWADSDYDGIIGYCDDGMSSMSLLTRYDDKCRYGVSSVHQLARNMFLSLVRFQGRNEKLKDIAMNLGDMDARHECNEHAWANDDDIIRLADKLRLIVLLTSKSAAAMDIAKWIDGWRLPCDDNAEEKATIKVTKLEGTTND